MWQTASIRVFILDLIINVYVILVIKHPEERNLSWTLGQFKMDFLFKIKVIFFFVIRSPVKARK